MVKNSWEEVKVNRKEEDKVVFESTVIQSIYDKFDGIRDGSSDILREIDSSDLKANIDELREYAFDHMEDVSDDISLLKDEIVDIDAFPETIRYTSREIKIGLNRDEDYIRKAKRRLYRSKKQYTNSYNLNMRAIGLCDKAIDLNPKNAEAYYLKGMAYVNLDDYVEAIDCFKYSLSLDNNIETKLKIAAVYRLNEQPIDAIAVYQIILDEDEDCFDAVKGQADAYFYLKIYDKSAEFYEKADSMGHLDSQSRTKWEICKENKKDSSE